MALDISIVITGREGPNSYVNGKDLARACHWYDCTYIGLFRKLTKIHLSQLVFEISKPVVVSIETAGRERFVMAANRFISKTSRNSPIAVSFWDRPINSQSSRRAPSIDMAFVRFTSETIAVLTGMSKHSDILFRLLKALIVIVEVFCFRLDTVERLVRTHPELIQPYSKGNVFSVMFPHTPLHLASRNGHK